MNLAPFTLEPHHYIEQVPLPEPALHGLMRVFWPRPLPFMLQRIAIALCFIVLCGLTPARAQTFRFNLRAEPDIIPANGISTASILVQVQNATGAGISAAPVVRFITTRGSIESQARLTGGVARVLLRSATTPGTAVITAFIGTAREQVTVEFSDDESGMARFLVVKAPYIAYGTDRNLLTASGPSSFDFGDTHLESDVRLDIDLYNETIWAEGSSGHVLIRHGGGAKAHVLRGDRLYYDLRRRRGVMRRVDTKDGPVRQEFMDADFRPIPDEAPATPGQKKLTGPNHAAAAKTILPPPNAGHTLPGPESIQPTQPAVATGTAPSAALPVPPSSAAPLSPEDSPAKSGQPSDIGKLGAAGKGVDSAQSGGAKGQPATKPDNNSPFAAVAAGRIQPDESANALLHSISATGSDEVFKAGATTFNVAPVTLDTTAPAGATPSAAPASSDPTQPHVLTALNAETKHPPEDSPDKLETIPSYQPLAPDIVAAEQVHKISEPLPPDIDITKGYWITARQVRVFPHDKIHFQHAGIFFAGRKLFAMPLYVVPLGTAFNPATELASFNSSGGLTLNVPYYYQASPHGTGTLFIQHAPSQGFAAEKSGFALALRQEYWLSTQSQGSLLVDQIGHDWNLNWQHKQQFSPTLSSNAFLDMPQHRSQYLTASLLKEYKAMQIGFESYYSHPQGQLDNMQGQFFARLRPRTIGNSQWTYTLAANVLASRRFTALVPVTDPSGGLGGGIGIPGGGGITVPGRGGIALPGQAREVGLRRLALVTTSIGPVLQVVTRDYPLYGQSFDATLAAPTYQLWHGANLQMSFLGTAFNYSDGRRGVAPGMSLGLQQSLGRNAALQLNYDYSRGGISLFGANITNVFTGSFTFNLKRKLGGSALLSKSLMDGSLYGLTSLDYYVSPIWRMSLFSDYSHFADVGNFLNYGWTLGRALGQREVTLNWDHSRNRIYFEFGNMRY